MFFKTQVFDLPVSEWKENHCDCSSQFLDWVFAVLAGIWAGIGAKRLVDFFQEVINIKFP